MAVGVYLFGMLGVVALIVGLTGRFGTRPTLRRLGLGFLGSLAAAFFFLMLTTVLHPEGQPTPQAPGERPVPEVLHIRPVWHAGVSGLYGVDPPFGGMSGG